MSEQLEYSRFLEQENARLRESQIYMRQLLATIVKQAGGELRVDERTVATMDTKIDVLTRHEDGFIVITAK